MAGWSAAPRCLFTFAPIMPQSNAGNQEDAMQPYRKRSLAHFDSGTSKRLPFPAASLTTILLVALVASTLSALYIGAHRRRNYVAVVRTKIPTVVPSSSGEEGIIGSTTGGGLQTDDVSGPSIRSLKDLTRAELHPEAGPRRHIVTPPQDTQPVTLVTCSTTAGYLHILVHPSWAPLGAERFLQMVNTKYFSSKVALMRCLKGFLCQFGIAGIPSYNKPYNGNLKDDPNWLPEGPTHRKNELGVKRFGKGYMAYAGGGKDTRGNQLIVALEDNERLGGGSPWEVPWGEVVGEESFRTLGGIYTGYGEDGPSQGRLSREGSSEGVERDFPKLDYVLGCDAIDSRG